MGRQRLEVPLKDFIAAHTVTGERPIAHIDIEQVFAEVNAALDAGLFETLGTTPGRISLEQEHFVKGGAIEKFVNSVRTVTGTPVLDAVLVLTLPGGEHKPHGGGSRRGQAGYDWRFVFQLAALPGSAPYIHYQCPGHDSCTLSYSAWHGMDSQAGSAHQGIQHSTKCPVGGLALVATGYRNSNRNSSIQAVGRLLAAAAERTKAELPVVAELPRFEAAAVPRREVPARTYKGLQICAKINATLGAAERSERTAKGADKRSAILSVMWQARAVERLAEAIAQRSDSSKRPVKRSRHFGPD